MDTDFDYGDEEGPMVPVTQGNYAVDRLTLDSELRLF